MIHADPLLARLAELSYPELPLRSTFVISLVTLLLALLTQNMVLAVVIGLLVLAGNGAVIHLLAVRDEGGSGVLLKVLRGGSAMIILLIVGTSLATPEGASGPSRQAPQTLQTPPQTRQTPPQTRQTPPQSAGSWPPAASVRPGLYGTP